MSEVVLVIENGLARLTLNRPGALNAYSLALARDLRAAIARVRDSDAAALVIQGEGRAFCAGGDVREMASSGDAAAHLRDLTRDVHAALRALRSLPLPVVARVHGAVAGGGLGLMLAADIVVAAESASFTAAYGAIGLSPDCGVTALLPAAIGAGRARAFLIEGRHIDAATALDWGLVSRVVPESALDDAVDEAAAAARVAGRAATAATKALLDGDGLSIDAQLDREAAAIAALAGSSAAGRIAGFAPRPSHP